MITRIEVDGFKSLQGFALDLEPFAALVGPNGAGKSNLIDALGLLSRIAEVDLKTAFGEGRGRRREQFSLWPGEVGARPEHPEPAKGRATIAIEVLLLRDTIVTEAEQPIRLAATRLRYELEISLHELSSGVEQFAVVRERLASLDQGSDAWIKAHPDLRSLALYSKNHAFFEASVRDGVLTRRADDPSALQTRTLVRSLSMTAAHLSRPGFWAVSPHLQAVSEELRGLRVVHLEPRALREPSERSAPEAMTASGVNMPTTLASLDKAVLAQIRLDLTSLVPGVRTFEVAADEDTFHVEVESTDGQRFSTRVLSDGTLRVLGLSTLLRSSPPGAIITIEEPENGIHPARVRELIEKLYESTSSRPDEPESGEEPRSPPLPESPRQVVITSHSPVVLAALLDHPESIRFFDMIRQGTGPRRTRARPIALAGELDRGQLTVSIREVERTLSAARSSEQSEP